MSKERDIQANIVEYLLLRRCLVVRVNGGALKDGKRFVKFNTVKCPGRKSSELTCPDLLAVMPGGKMLALEVKRPGEKATDGQGVFLAEAERLGALSAVVTSVEDVAGMF